MKCLVLLALFYLASADIPPRKREADGEPEPSAAADRYYGGYLGGYRKREADGEPEPSAAADRGYGGYRKREADGEPESSAAADRYYGGYLGGSRTQLWKPTVNSKYIEKHCAILVGFIGKGGGRYRLSFQCLNSDHAVSQGAPASPASRRTKKAQIKETGPAS